VGQAHSQTAAGEYSTAAATIERALRIEPENPLLWIELGKVREAEGNHAQAEAMARKALVVAGSDTRAQSAAWRLIAETLRARGRVSEAREADTRASQPATH
jgi:Flp pilus assembly protein TadD